MAIALHLPRLLAVLLSFAVDALRESSVLSVARGLQRANTGRS